MPCFGEKISDYLPYNVHVLCDQDYYWLHCHP